MIGIQAIGTYLPENRIKNLSKLVKFEVDQSFLAEKIGMVELAIKAEDEETSDLCCKAFYDLQKNTNIKSDEVDCIVVCTQNPDSKGLPHTSSIVHAKLGLKDTCAAFDISLGCSGFVYSLSIIQAFMQANGFKKSILFTSDPYSKVIDLEDKNTSLLFGDGAAATLISDDPVWVAGNFVFGSHGKESSAIQVSAEKNKLSMNGRAVFSFSATTVPVNISTMLERNGLSIDQVDLFVLHQGSRYIVDTIKKKLGVDDAKVPFLATMYGNTVSSSIPFILKEYISQPPRHVVIAGFGVGLSWASGILKSV